MRLAVLIIPALVALASPALAQVYEYTTPDGVTHYSNVPPGRRDGVRVTQPSPRPPQPRLQQPSTDSLRFLQYDAHIREAAALYRLPESFLRAVIAVESNYHPEVVSHAGACGLMQLMPQTAVRMGVTDIFDPRQNILGGARLLRILANTFNGDLVLTIAAYNAGEGAVLRYRGVPPYEETQRYVRRVLQWYYGYVEAETRAHQG
jgi:soluble lytic murein transglycosylase-like protein